MVVRRNISYKLKNSFLFKGKPIYCLPNLAVVLEEEEGVGVEGAVVGLGGEMLPGAGEPLRGEVFERYGHVGMVRTGVDRGFAEEWGEVAFKPGGQVAKGVVQDDIDEDDAGFEAIEIAQLLGERGGGLHKIMQEGGEFAEAIFGHGEWGLQGDVRRRIEGTLAVETGRGQFLEGFYLQGDGVWRD